MARSGSGHIIIHLPQEVSIWINGVDYTDHVLSYEFKESENLVGEFFADLIEVGTTEKVDVAEGNDIQFRLANDLLFKGTIERPNYMTYDYCSIKGLGAVETILKNSTVEWRPGKCLCDVGSKDGRPIYSGTTSGVETGVIVAGQLSGIANVSVGTNEYLGNIVARSDNDNELSFLDGMVRGMSGVWWSSYGSYPYTTNYYNVAKDRGSGTSLKTFNVSGAKQNADETSREVDEENLFTSVKISGYGDGENQIYSKVYHATDNFTKLISGITTSETIIAVESTSGFPASTTWSDGFEDGNYNGWTHIGAGSVTVQSVVVKTGTYAVKLTPAGASADSLNRNPLSLSRTWDCWTRVDNTAYGCSWSVKDLTSVTGISLGIVEGNFKYNIDDGAWVDTGIAASVDTWYKFRINYTSGASSFTVKVFNTSLAELCSTSPSITPFNIDRIRMSARTLNAHSAYFDDVSFAKRPIIWVGMEQMEYEVIVGNTFTGCSRATIDSIDSDNQSFLKSYNHNAGVAVYDRVYTETSTDGNSKIDEHGLQQISLADKRILSQNTLDLVAINYLFDHFEKKERITIVDSDPIASLVSGITVGSIVTVTDTESVLSGDYRVVGRTFQNNEGLEGLIYELSNGRSTFTEDLRTTKQVAKVGSEYMQGSTTFNNIESTEPSDANTPIEVFFNIPSETIKVNSVKLSIRNYAPKTWTGNSAVSNVITGESATYTLTGGEMSKLASGVVTTNTNMVVFNIGGQFESYQGSSQEYVWFQLRNSDSDIFDGTLIPTRDINGGETGKSDSFNVKLIAYGNFNGETLNPVVAGFNLTDPIDLVYIVNGYAFEPISYSTTDIKIYTCDDASGSPDYVEVTSGIETTIGHTIVATEDGVDSDIDLTEYFFSGATTGWKAVKIEPNGNSLHKVQIITKCFIESR